MADNKYRFEITELFMAQTYIDRRFSGTIKRGSDSDEHPVIRDRIKVLEGFVLAQVACQDVLGNRLDEIVKMVRIIGCMMTKGSLLWWQGLSVCLIEPS